MNDEFNPKYLLLQQGEKKFKNKKPQRPTRPDRLPIELSYYNRAVINFLFVLIMVTSLIINFD